jgi:hypothetical protein
VPPTASPSAPAADLFTTRQALDQELTVTGAWKAVHAAVHASTPRLSSHPYHNQGEPVCGLRFTEDTPHIGQAPVVVTPDGILTVRAYTVPGHRWLTALSQLGTLDPRSILPGAATAPADPASPSWSLRPR